MITGLPVESAKESGRLHTKNELTIILGGLSK